jgi:hypothetical protein
MRTAVLLSVMGLGAFGAGCITTRVPTEELVDAQVSIRAAEELGASEVPLAARHLALAREQTRTAQKFLEQGERKDAARALKRAEVDAEMAMALAREAPLQAEAQRALQRVDELERATQ